MIPVHKAKAELPVHRAKAVRLVQVIPVRKDKAAEASVKADSAAETVRKAKVERLVRKAKAVRRVHKAKAAGIPSAETGIPRIVRAETTNGSRMERAAISVTTDAAARTSAAAETSSRLSVARRSTIRRRKLSSAAT